MPGIIEFPKVVQDALDRYGDLFANQCQHRHLAEYLTGLFVAQRKTVLGIHDEFAQTTDQSCLNRFLTEVPWDVQTLNQRRLERLQEDLFTRYSDHGVIAIDNTLIDRDGLLIPDAGWFCHHAGNEREVLTHPERLILTHLVLQDSRSGQGRQFRFTPPFGSSWTSSTRESGSSRRSSRRSGNDASGGPKAPRSSARPGRSGSTR